MLIQKDIEEKMVQALRVHLGTIKSVEVRGAWAEAFSGLTRWSENPESDAFVSVALGTPSRTASTDPSAAMSANVSVFVRIERDPTGAKLCAIAEALQELFDVWIGFSHNDILTDLDIEEFSVDSISLSAGGSPTLQNDVAAVTYPLEISGSFT